MAYVVTTWVNDQAPALSAANLNKLTDEIKAQALAEGIAHALPTWVNGAVPAITDGGPWNEMERVTAAVAAAKGLAYARTTWQGGWVPSRNANNLNRLEQQVATNSLVTPPAPGAWEGPITINSSGVIANRSFESTSSGQRAVNINTDQMVTLQNCRIRNLAGGDLIRAASGWTVRNLTLENCWLYGGAGRVLDVENVDRLIVRNCTFDKTSGMKITVSNPTQILLTRNRHTNIQYAALSQFSQLGVVSGNVEISWNEIINEPELSHVEDILSIYVSSGIYVHDNFFKGQWAPGNSGDTSQNGITIEQAGSNNNRIENNQLAGCMGGIGIFDGDNNLVLNNRVVRSGYYPDGTTRVVAGFSGIGVSPGQFSDNHLHGNLVGYVSGTKHGFGRTDWADDSMPAHCLPTNTRYPGTVTLQSEADEWTFWQNKLATNGIVVGAS